MRKNSKYISISEYCKANGLKPNKFYEAIIPTQQEELIGIGRFYVVYVSLNDAVQNSLISTLSIGFINENL